MATKQPTRRAFTVNGVTWNLIQRGDLWYAQRREDGRRVTRSTNQTTLKAAREVIEQWEHQRANPTVLRHFAEPLFLPGSQWIERQERRPGEPLSEQTIYEHRLHVERYILPEFGERDASTILAPEIEDWLYTIEVSNRYRRHVEDRPLRDEPQGPDRGRASCGVPGQAEQEAPSVHR